MKNISTSVATLALACVGVLASTNMSAQDEKKANAPDGWTAYGEIITAENTINMDELARDMQDKEAMKAKVEATAVTSCAKKGCWMDVKMPDGNTMKVTFKDYGFFVPVKGMEDRSVIMEGSVERNETSVEMLQHYAEDAGKSKEEIEKITEPELALNFVATGVLVKD